MPPSSSLLRNNSSSGSLGLFEGIALPPGPSLAHLPDPVVWQFLRIARNVICCKFVPICWVRAAKRRRERLRIRRPVALEHMGVSRACETALTEASEFVHSISASSELSYFLSKKGTHTTFQPGEIIFHDGETNSSGVFVLVSGRVNLFRSVHRVMDSTRYYGLQGVAPPSSHSRNKNLSSPDVGISDMSGDGAAVADDVCSLRNDSVLDFRGENHPHHLRFASMKPKGLTNTHFVRSLSAPFVFGDLGILNDEPRLFYCVAASPVDVVIVPRSSFFAALQGLPNASGPLRVVSVAHAVRAANLPVAFPLTINRLRQSPLFSRFTDEELQLLLVCAQPKVFAQGMTILERNRPCPNVYLIRRGVVEEIKERGGSFNGSLRTSVALWEGATFGEREGFFKERSDAQYIASTNVDLYQIPMEEVTRMCSRSEMLKARVAEAAKLLRVYDPHEDVLQSAKAATAQEGHSSGESPNAAGTMTNAEYLTKSNKTKRYVELMRAIPLWRAVNIPRDLLEALAPHWQSHLYSRGEFLFHKSDMCDKMMIVLRGHAKLMDVGPLSHGSVMTINECVGYTCLVEHRWEHSAMATEVTEVISLPRGKLLETLRLWDSGLLRPAGDPASPIGGAGGVVMDALLQMAPAVGQEKHVSDIVADGAGRNDGKGKQSSRCYQQLLHATTQLLQPLYRRSSTATSSSALQFPDVDAAVRRAPNPNSFHELTIANLHPFSREEHVRLFPPFSNAAEGARPPTQPRDNSGRQKKQFLTEYQAFQAKQQASRRGMGSSGSFFVPDNGPLSGSFPRRRSTKAAEPAVQPSAQEKPNVAHASLPAFQLPERPPSRTTVADASAVKTDPVGNILIESSPAHSSQRAQPAPGSKVRSTVAETVRLGDVHGGNDSRTTLGDSHISGSGPQVAGAQPQQLSSPTTVVTTHDMIMQIGRMTSPIPSSAVDDIFKPLRPYKRVDGAEQPSGVVGPERAPRDDGGAPLSTRSTPAPPPPPSSRQAPKAILLQPTRLKAVTPRAKKTMTYSAYENYGSLMQSMVDRCCSPRLASSENMVQQKDSTAEATDVVAAGALVEPKNRTSPRYMWQSTSVATPLLPSRPSSAILNARRAEALKVQERGERCSAASPRCTAFYSQRSYVRSLAEASHGPTSPKKKVPPEHTN